MRHNIRIWKKRLHPFFASQFFFSLALLYYFNSKVLDIYLGFSFLILRAAPFQPLCAPLEPSLYLSSFELFVITTARCKDIDRSALFPCIYIQSYTLFDKSPIFGAWQFCGRGITRDCATLLFFKGILTPLVSAFSLENIYISR